MNKDTIKEILYIIIAITFGIITVRFIIWLLPMILIAFCSYRIYKYIKKDKRKSSKEKTKPKNKEIKIIDMKIDD